MCKKCHCSSQNIPLFVWTIELAVCVCVPSPFFLSTCSPPPPFSKAMSITRLSLSVSQNSTPRRALPKRLPVSQLLLSQALKDAILAPTPSNPTNATPPRLSLDIALVDQVRRKWLPQKAAPSSAGLNTVNSPLYIRLEGGQRFPSARDLLALPVEVRSTVLQLAIGVLMFRLVPIVAVHLRRKAKSRLLRFLLSSRFNSRPSSSFLSPLPVFSNCQGLEELCEQGFEPRVFTYEEVIVFKGEPAESGPVCHDLRIGFGSLLPLLVRRRMPTGGFAALVRRPLCPWGSYAPLGPSTARRALCAHLWRPWCGCCHKRRTKTSFHVNT